MNGKVIIHHGIENQRWHHRNGPPYPLDNSQRSVAERKANPESDSSKGEAPSQKPNYRPKKERETRTNSRKLKRREVKRLTDAELSRRSSRLESEKRYLELQNDVEYKTRPVKMALNSALREAGKKALTNIATDVFTALGQKAITKMFHGKNYTELEAGMAYFGKNFKSKELAKQKYDSKNAEINKAVEKAANNAYNKALEDARKNNSFSNDKKDDKNKKDKK